MNVTWNQTQPVVIEKIVIVKKDEDDPDNNPSFIYDENDFVGQNGDINIEVNGLEADIEYNIYLYYSTNYSGTNFEKGLLNSITTKNSYTEIDSIVFENKTNNSIDVKVIYSQIGTADIAIIYILDGQFNQISQPNITEDSGTYYTLFTIDFLDPNFTYSLEVYLNYLNDPDRQESNHITLNFTTNHSYQNFNGVSVISSSNSASIKLLGITSGTINYEVQYKLLDQNSNVLIDWTTASDYDYNLFTFEISNLTIKTNYEVVIRIVYDSNQIDSSQPNNLPEQSQIFVTLDYIIPTINYINFQNSTQALSGDKVSANFEINISNPDAVNYDLEYSLDNGNTWLKVEDYIIDGVQFTINNLDPNTSYNFSFRINYDGSYSNQIKLNILTSNSFDYFSDIVITKGLEEVEVEILDLTNQGTANYEIQYSLNSGDWFTVDKTNIVNNKFVIPNLISNTNYLISIRLNFENVISDDLLFNPIFIYQAAKNTKTLQPAIITELNIYSQTSNTISLSYKISNPDQVSFTLEYLIDGVSNWIEIPNDSEEGIFIIYNLNSSTIYKISLRVREDKYNEPIFIFAETNFVLPTQESDWIISQPLAFSRNLGTQNASFWIEINQINFRLDAKIDSEITQIYIFDLDGNSYQGTLTFDQQQNYYRVIFEDLPSYTEFSKIEIYYTINSAKETTTYIYNFNQVISTDFNNATANNFNIESISSSNNDSLIKINYLNNYIFSSEITSVVLVGAGKPDIILQQDDPNFTELDNGVYEFKFINTDLSGYQYLKINFTNQQQVIQSTLLYLFTESNFAIDFVNQTSTSVDVLINVPSIYEKDVISVYFQNRLVEYNYQNNQIKFTLNNLAPNIIYDASMISINLYADSNSQVIKTISFSSEIEFSLNTSNNIIFIAIISSISAVILALLGFGIYKKIQSKRTNLVVDKLPKINKD